MIRLFVVVGVALRALAGHKLRSFLTMLGVVIGVAAVISLVAVGQGTQAQVLNQFQALGSNLLTVSAAQSVGFSRTGLRQASRQLNNADVEAISGLATTVSMVAPEYGAPNVTVSYEGKSATPSVTGVTHEYATVRNSPVTKGRFISAADNETLATVVVLGEKVVSDLFGSAEANPIGQVVRINRQNYEVIGVLKTKGQSGFTNQDNVILMPLRTAQIRLGGTGTSTVRQISLQVRSAEEMNLAEAQVTAILRALHGLRASAANDFRVQNQADLVQNVTEATGTFTVLLGSIAAISLLVGGIGIMNIMLVSVTERVREIGIRKAVGAKRRDILVQFLTEAAVLSVLGGVVGVAAGIAGAQVVTPLLGAQKALVTSESVGLALSVSLGIGVFFGIYPASRAAALNPIDALRYE